MRNMKKTMPIIMATIIVLIAFAMIAPTAVAKPPKPPKGQVIIVPDHYPTIQGAVNVAVDGDTIKVEPGTYVESVTISKSIKLRGGCQGRDDNVPCCSGC